MSYEISDDCIGCGSCAKKCPEKAITGEIKVRFRIDPTLCKECNTCFTACRKGAVINPQGERSPQKSKTRKLPKAIIDPEICAGCKNCYLNCPQDAVVIIKRGFFSNPYCRINQDACVGCGTCTENCITGAVELA